MKLYVKHLFLLTLLLSVVLASASIIACGDDDDDDDDDENEGDDDLNLDDDDDASTDDDDDDDDDTVPQCTVEDICNQFVTECGEILGIIYSLQECISGINSMESDCQDFDGYVYCHCICINDYPGNTEQECGMFQSCTDTCWAAYCP